MSAPAILTARSAEFFTAELCHITELSNAAADEALSVARARLRARTRRDKAVNEAPGISVPSEQELALDSSLQPQSVSTAIDTA